MELLNAAAITQTLSGGAFVEQFVLPPHSTGPLNSCTFAVKDMFDVKGHVASFGNPTWAETHLKATSTAPTILDLLKSGATCVGTTITDELAYSIMGKNIHYGTPRNPAAPNRVPGGSSSGSASAVGGALVDFSLGTDCIGSARLPASYCGIFGFRPSKDAIPSSGVIPLAQSLDTIGWFARDPTILGKVGQVLLQLPSILPARPTKIIIADDCFQLSSIPYDVLTGNVIKAMQNLFGGDVLQHQNIGDYVKDKVPSLKHFNEFNFPPLAALSCAMQLLASYEFKINHGGWVREVNPVLGPGVSENVLEALKTTGENIDTCHAIFKEMRYALNDLLEDFGVIMIPTVPGPPPTLQTNLSELKYFNGQANSLFSIAGVSGGCQVSIPLGMYNNLPISISLVAKHGADELLLSLAEIIYNAVKEEESTKPEA